MTPLQRTGFRRLAFGRPSRRKNKKTSASLLLRFLRDPKASKGNYNLLLIVHHGYRLMPAISFKISPSAKYGIVILPRDLAPDDPLFKFAK